MKRMLITLGFTCLVLFGRAVLADGFSVERASSRLADDVYLMDADLKLPLSTEALEAVHSGIPIVILIEVEVTRYRQYGWDETVASLEQRFELEFHPLSERYVVRNINTDIARSFQTLVDALHAIGRIRDYPLLGSRFVHDDEQYQAEVEVELEIEALPAPMRPLAYFNSHWRLSSEPYSWPLTP